MHLVKRTTVEEEHEPQASDGFFRPEGNPRHVFERRTTPLCFTQPYYNPLVSGPLKVPNEPFRMTPALREIRGEEVAAHGARRVKEIRRLSEEYKQRIKDAADRDKAIEAEKNKNAPRLRWWHTRQSVETRDLLKTMKFNNFTFNPQALLNAKDVVILNLTGCCLGDEQMVWISTFLQQNNTLRRLNLQGNKITVEGVRNLRPGIRASHSIIDIDISLNPIGDAGLNELVSGFSENLRHTKIARINISTCDLSASSGYHIARLIRDFKMLEAIFAWRNRIGYVQSSNELTGVSLIFEELAVTKTLKHIDLSANVISEEVCLKHATVMEQIARERRLAAIEKTNRAAKIESMTANVNEMKSQDLWEDERVILAGLERELAQEKVRYKQQIEEEVRLKRLKNKDFDWVQRVTQLTGRELCDPKSQVRLVLMGNHAVTPGTISRLSQFYDLNSKDDTIDWLTKERKYDKIVVPRRQPGQEYEFLDESQSMESHYNVFSYEDEMLAKERAAQLQREQEMEDIRRRGGSGGKMASEVLEERLRGRSSQRSRRPSVAPSQTQSEGLASPAVDSLANTQSAFPAGFGNSMLGVPGTAKTGGRSPRRRDITIVEGDDEAGPLTPRSPHVEQPARSGSHTPHERSFHTPRGHTPRGHTPRGRTPRGVRSPSVARLEAGGDNTSRSTPNSQNATPAAAGIDPLLVEQSDAELFSDASESVRTRPDGSRQRRTARRVAASHTSKRGDAKTHIGMSINVAAESPRKPKTTDAYGFDDSDNGGRDDIDAFDDDVFAGGDSDMTALFERLVPKSDHNTASGMQRKLEIRMEEVRERIAAKTEARPEAAAPTVLAAELAQSLKDEEETQKVEIRPHHETGEITIVVKAQPEQQEATEAAAAASVELATSVREVPETVDPFAVAKALLSDGILTLHAFSENITALSQIGSPTDDDLELLAAEKAKSARFKASLAEQLLELHVKIPVPPELVDGVGGFLEDLVKETDRSPGVSQLVRAILEAVDVDWPTIIDNRALGPMAACDGSLDFLRAFVNVPGARFDMVELACSCFFNQAVRIPLAHIVLQHAHQLRLSDVADDLQTTWQEFFEDVASNKRSIPREDRSARLELLDAMLKFADIPLDMEAEGPDGQSCFSRACLEGDLDVVQLLISNGKVTDVNIVRSDGMTALHSAVIGNNVDLVNYLLNAPSLGQSIDVNVASDEGNPLDIAILLQRDGRIAAMLKGRGATQSSKSSGKKPKPKGKANVSVGAAASKLAGRAKRR